jgi:hypothetical protein
VRVDKLTMLECGHMTAIRLGAIWRDDAKKAHAADAIHASSSRCETGARQEASTNDRRYRTPGSSGPQDTIRAAGTTSTAGRICPSGGARNRSHVHWRPVWRERSEPSSERRDRAQSMSLAVSQCQVGVRETASMSASVSMSMSLAVADEWQS